MVKNTKYNFSSMIFTWGISNVITFLVVYHVNLNENRPSIHIFECLFLRWLNYFRGIRICGLDWGLKSSHLLVTFVFILKLSATALALCLHVLCYDSHGLAHWSVSNPHINSFFYATLATESFHSNRKVTKTHTENVIDCLKKSQDRYKDFDLHIRFCCSEDNWKFRSS